MARTDSDSSQISAGRGGRSSRKLVLVKPSGPIPLPIIFRTSSCGTIRSAESQTVEDGNFRGPRSRVSKSLAHRGGLIMVR